MECPFSQPVGLWRTRNAPEAYIKLALGECLQNDIHEELDPICDNEGFGLWHYWADGPEPEQLWDDLRLRFKQSQDLKCAINGEHPLYRLLLKNKNKAASLWMNEAKWDRDLKVQGDTLWHALAWNGTQHFDEISTLLSPHNINDVDIDGLTPAAIAVHRGGREALKHWMFLGVDPNIVDNHQRTVLHHVALYGDISWFTEIQDMGADETARNDRGQTALDMLQEHMKHFQQEKIDASLNHWARRYFQKCIL